MLLRVDPSHGYNLLEGLQQFGFEQGTFDASVVYRILRQMEQEGWLASQWDTEGSGPSRRVYHVTQDGEAYLATWIEDLRCTRDEIDRFIDMFEHPQPLTVSAAAPGADQEEQPVGASPEVE